MTGPGAFWYTGGGEAQLLSGGPITGTAALSVTQPAIAASGTFTAAPITGTASLTVAQPVISASGTFTPLAITGTAALTVPQPSIAASGAIPVTLVVVGGRARRAVIPRYRERRATVVGEAALAVKPPKIRARGFVTTLEDLHEERSLFSLVDDDEDLALALTLADTWLN